MSARKKQAGKTPRPSDRHKPRRQVGIRGPLAAQAELLADRLAQDLTQVVNDAVRERLEREGLWPPRGDASSCED